MTKIGIYRHYKGGTYRVLHVARDSTNGREGRMVVVYVSLTTGLLLSRDEAQFHELVAGVPRFAIVEAKH